MLAVWILQGEHRYTKPYVLFFLLHLSRPEISTSAGPDSISYLYSKYKVGEKPVLIYISFASVYCFAKSFYFPEAIWICALSFAPAPIQFLEITISKWVPGNQWFLHCLHQLFPQLSIYIASELQENYGLKYWSQNCWKQIKIFFEKYQN